MRKTLMVLAVAGALAPGIQNVAFADPEQQEAAVQSAAQDSDPAGDRDDPQEGDAPTEEITKEPTDTVKPEVAEKREVAEALPAPEDEVLKKASITAEPNVADDIDAYLASRGWAMGENTRPDGSVFYISVGQGVIAAPRDSGAYMTSRLIAFEKALLEAKKEMVQYMESRVAKEVLSDYQEGGVDNAEVAPGSDKSASLLAGAVNDELARQGVESRSPEASAKVRQLLSSSTFRSSIRTVAQARILGLQVFKSFEASPSGRQGQIGVICIHSDKLQDMAEAMWSGAPIPPQSPKPPLIDQVPSEREVLLSSYGVQQKTDEQGNLVLVAFAQAKPVSSSVNSENAAYDKAKTNALGLLRQFAGESAHVATSTKNAESIREMEGSAIDYSNETTYRSQIQSYAEEMSISGVAVLKRWSAVHPLTGEKVVGIVCTWSPRAAQRATQLKQRVSGKPVPAGAANDHGAKPSGGGQEGVYHGQGAEGDPDSF
jgi:hypothetical protein